MTRPATARTLRGAASHIAAAEVAVNGSITVKRGAVAELRPGILRDGEVTDAPALAEALKTFFAENDLPTRVRLGVANQRIVVRSIDLPPLGFPSRYRKARDRASFAFALVSVAAALRVEDGVVADVRLALGGVAHRPWRATAAEEALRGGPATEEAFAAAADAELAAATPLRENRFKVPLARNLVVRTLLEVAP